MFHKGLNQKIIVDAAKELIEQEGFPAFSMRKLAETLNVKTASLYARIESMEALFTEIGLSALRKQWDCLLNAVAERHGDAAIIALAKGYRHFAVEHAELYRLIRRHSCSSVWSDGNHCRNEATMLRDYSYLSWANTLSTQSLYSGSWSIKGASLRSISALSIFEASVESTVCPPSSIISTANSKRR